MSIEIRIKKELKNFNLNIEFITECKKIGLLGFSGAGKTQILKSIAGLNDLTSGYIKHNDIVFFDSENKINIKPQNRNTGYLFQNYALFPHMTVEEQLRLTSKRDDLEELCKNFKIDHLLKSKPDKISGGESQRVAMIRMLATNPNIILLDEPFSALDVNLKLELRAELREMLKDFEGTIIIVSHDIEDITELCEEIICIENGRVTAQTKLSELDKNMNDSVAKLVGYKSCEINSKTLFYNPKNFSLVKKEADIEFHGEIVDMYESINNSIYTLRCEGQNIRIELPKDIDLKFGEVTVYQKIISN